MRLDVGEALDDVVVGAAEEFAFDGFQEFRAVAGGASDVGNDEVVALFGEENGVPAGGPGVEGDGGGTAVKDDGVGVWGR